LNGAPLIRRVHEQLASRFDEILISTNEPAKHAFLGAWTVPDRVPGKGPLMGIASALEAARHEYVFVTACDIPVIDLDTVARMLVLAEDFDCVIPMSSVGYEPLFAVYRKSALPAMHEALEAGERRISVVFPRVRTRFYDLGHAPWYRNLNTREDVAAFLAARG
jgi:molybdopterin-guanine dinucleotide biosynthesis protein A